MMWTGEAATVVALMMLAIYSLAGVIVGYVACLAFRFPWTARTVTWDVVTASLGAIVGILVYMRIAPTRSESEYGVMWALAAGSTSVLIRYLVRLARRGGT